MNASTAATNDDQLAQEAAHWCMRLHEQSCTEDDHAAFRLWLEADPRHAEEYQAMLGIWSLSEQLPRSPKFTPPEHANLAAPTRTDSRRRRRPALRAAAALLLALPLAGYGGWFLGWLPNSYQHYQSTAQVLPISLPDGSELELNLNTRLSFSNYSDQRRANLEQGEAYFEVKHDPQQPFVVQAGDSSVTVTGTRFNVLRYRDNVVVTVTEGSVRVRTSPQSGDSNITSGMQASYRQGDPLPHTRSVDTSKALAWRAGKLILDDLSLAQALPLINRYLDTPLELADGAAANLRIGGIYNTHELAGIIDILPQVLPIQISRTAEGRLLIKSRYAQL
jgi:transmembrane sensor